MMASIGAAKKATAEGLNIAVHRNRALSRAGALERLFTFAFRGLVYPQIWEDPVVDMEALDLRPDDHVVAIASGGCNVMSYLTADPARITAIDLNGAHIALNRLKAAAARHLPDYESFFRFFGQADDPANIAAYRHHVAPHLDPLSRAYWESRTLTGRRRIGQFSRNFYRFGLLGNFIGAAHFVARLHGRNPPRILDARDITGQRLIYERELRPVFESRLVRWLVAHPASLYGLGIPPAQYKALAGEKEGGMASVLRERLRRLACDFDIRTNYFAWQAFGRGYGPHNEAPLPPYLERRNYEIVRDRVGRIDHRQMSMTAYLQSCPSASLDAYVLLDAQDWMSDADLTALWAEITRTARRGARVIFRTAADERLLPNRIPEDVLSRWTYDEARSRDCTSRDRSSIYGAFHLYVLAETA